MKTLGFVIAAVMMLFFTGVGVRSQELQPGDDGYGHEILHEQGVVTELNTATGNNCCDGKDCRATYVNMKNRTVFINGYWCPIPKYVGITYNLQPLKEPIDGLAVACAKYAGNGKSEPHIQSNPHCEYAFYCIGISSGM